MIGKRIIKLRKEKGETQTETARKIGISRSSLSLYEIGKREPDIEMLNTLADYFNVSLDYLLGRTTNIDKQHNNFYFFFFDAELKKIFQLRLKKAIVQSALSENDICTSTKINIDTFQKYLSAEVEPSLEDLISLSQVLNVTTDYLLGQSAEMTDESRNLLNAFHKLNKDYQDIVVGEAKKALRDQRYEESVAADELKQAK